jgi:two-component system KDP operon response regulator KdpE
LILAVDDEAGILRLIRLELTSQGFRVIIANDGEEALRLAEQQRPDIVVLDIVMPDMSGLEVMRRLRERMSVPAGADQVVRVANIEIDLGSRLVKKEGVVVSLTRTEWMLLQHLAANAGKVMLNTELLSKVWGPEYRDDLQYLRVWVSRLRSKLEPDPANPTIIKTLQGIGYLLDAEGHFSEQAQEAANGRG